MINIVLIHVSAEVFKLLRYSVFDLELKITVFFERDHVKEFPFCFIIYLIII